ncbi:MAG: thiamine diphosphokinase [Spirochaetales bacterium]|nr:thiamine diphosphokinase [Spirochaetales bacterium]
MKKKLALVITGGAAPPLNAIEPLLKTCDFLVAADSGLEQALEYGYTPDMVVGDMDSLGNRALLDTYPPERVKIYPVDKDYTDTELALDEIASYDRRILIGGGEGRLDHTLALLNLFEGPRFPDLWISGREEIFPLDKSVELEGVPGEIISFYPLGSRNIQFKSRGLKWPLDGVKWKEGELSLSNRFTEERVSLERGEGSLLVIRTLPDPPA